MSEFDEEIDIFNSRYIDDYKDVDFEVEENGHCLNYYAYRINEKDSTRTIYMTFKIEDDIETVTTYPISTFPNYFGYEKYSGLKSISFIGFNFSHRKRKTKNVSFAKRIVKEFPIPFYKNFDYGFGVNKKYSNLIYDIINRGFTSIVILENNNIKYENKNNEFIISFLELDKARKLMDRIEDKIDDMKSMATQLVIDNTYDNVLNKTDIPIINKLPQKMENNINLLLKYTKNAAIKRISYDELIDTVEKDIEKIVKRRPKKLYDLKDNIELVFLEDILNKFKSLLEESTSEKKWQEFFKINISVLSLALPYPIVFYKDEAYVGGKTVDDNNGKKVDFLLKNTLSGNLSILELKKSNTSILNKKEYRQGVYPPSTDLVGGVSQVLSQKETFISENKSLIRDNSKVIDIPCVLLIGNAEKENIYSDDKKNSSFELFRNAVHGVHIITFDEIYKKLELLHEALKKR